jgi:hypothetical protein
MRSNLAFLLVVIATSVCNVEKYLADIIARVQSLDYPNLTSFWAMLAPASLQKLLRNMRIAPSRF